LAEKMKIRTKRRLVWSGVLATVAALPAAFVGYMLGYHSALPILGGGPMAVLVPSCVVWGAVFTVGALRARFLSLCQPEDER
jgi:hypothetical protein